MQRRALACSHLVRPSGCSQGRTSAAVAKRNQSNAYMLVYVRKADWERVMRETGKEVMEPRTRAILEAQHAEKLEKRRSKMQAHRFVKLHVFTYEQMQGHVRFCFYPRFMALCCFQTAP